MSSSRLILAVGCALALSTPAFAQVVPAPTPGRVLTQEYARLYREFLDKKKLGLDADAATKYAEFLAAFRKHRLISRLGVPNDGGPVGSGNGDGGISVGGTQNGGTANSDPQPGDTGGAQGHPILAPPVVGVPASAGSPPSTPAPPPADDGGGTTTAP